jgi:GH35 family endo-1,4-beta-xylanase
MGVTAKKINPEDFILSALSPEDRLNAAFDVAREAFKKSRLTMKDIDNAVKSVRRKAYEKKK